MAIFTPAYNPQHWKPVFPWKPEIQDRTLARRLARGARGDRRAQRRAWPNKKPPSRSSLPTSQRPYRERLREAKLNQLPEAIRGDTKAALDTPPDQRSEVQKYLAQKFDKTLEVNPGRDRRCARRKGPGNPSPIGSRTRRSASRNIAVSARSNVCSTSGRRPKPICSCAAASNRPARWSNPASRGHSVPPDAPIALEPAASVPNRRGVEPPWPAG